MQIKPHLLSKYSLYSLEGITPLNNCLCRVRRQPAMASYIVSTLALLLVRKEGKCCYVFMSLETLTGLSRLETDCGRSARHPPLSEELFALSSPVLPASAHEIEEFMNAADEKRQLHQVMRARQRLNASLCG
jgi:hypothetical protein